MVPGSSSPVGADILARGCLDTDIGEGNSDRNSDLALFEGMVVAGVGPEGLSAGCSIIDRSADSSACSLVILCRRTGS